MSIFMEIAAMSNSKKILIGIFSVLPLIFFIIYMGSIIGLMIDLFRDGAMNGSRGEDLIRPQFENMVGIVISAVVLGLLSLGVLVYFIIHAVNNQSINSNERIIWILIFIFIGMITFPIYWYTRVWKTPDPFSPVQKS